MEAWEVALPVDRRPADELGAVQVDLPDEEGPAVLAGLELVLEDRLESLGSQVTSWTGSPLVPSTSAGMGKLAEAAVDQAALR